MSEENIIISYMHIDKVIEIPNDYNELLESFIEKFEEDEKKDYIFFFKDNDDANNEDIREKDYIKKDICYSDFHNKKKIYVQEIKKEKDKVEEKDTETEIGSINLADSIHSLNSNESFKTNIIYCNIEKELSKQTEDKNDKGIKNEYQNINNIEDEYNNINPNEINNIIKLDKLIEETLKKNREISINNNKNKKENEKLVKKLKEKDNIIKEKEEQINQCKLNVGKKYESNISELERKIIDIKNSESNEKEENKKKNIDLKNKIDEVKRNILEKKSKNCKLYFEKEKLLIAKRELEEQLFNEEKKLDNESKNRYYDLILPINDSLLENELKFAALKKVNMENKNRIKISEISKIFEKKFKKYQNEKIKMDINKILKLEQIQKSKIIKYGKIVNKNEDLDENKIIEENENLKEKIFEIKEQETKKGENKSINNDKKENKEQKNEIIVLSDKQINGLRNKVKESKDESIKGKNEFSIFNNSDDENGDRNDAPNALELIENNNNNKIYYSSLDESLNKSEAYYSYSCINNKDLISYIDENTESTKIEIEIENNGTKDWPENNAKLIFEQKSQIRGKDIILKSQKCKEKNKYEIQFHNLSQYKEGRYESYAYININDWRGNQIIFKIIINKKKINSEIEEHLDIILEFRKEFSLEPKEYPNEKILYVLKNNDYDKGLAFAELFNK
jgi:hypothetical protein